MKKQIRLASIRECCNECKDIKALENMNDLLVILLRKFLTALQQLRAKSSLGSFQLERKEKQENKMDHKLISTEARDLISCTICDLWVYTSCTNEPSPGNSPCVAHDKILACIIHDKIFHKEYCYCALLSTAEHATIGRKLALPYTEEGLPRRHVAVMPVNSAL